MNKNPNGLNPQQGLNSHSNGLNPQQGLNSHSNGLNQHPGLNPHSNGLKPQQGLNQQPNGLKPQQGLNPHSNGLNQQQELNPHQRGLNERKLRREIFSQGGKRRKPGAEQRGNRSRKGARADFHDYTAPGIYMITITASSPIIPLSVIKMPDKSLMQKGMMIIPDNTDLGEYVKNALLALPQSNPALQIGRYVIMPDHIHFILNVTSYLEKPIGKFLAPFTKSCSGAYTDLLNLPAFTTLFKPYDDRIIFNPEQLSRAIKYIEDNPRRYLIKRQYPDLFHRYLHLTVGDHEYAAYGNIFLLRSIHLLPVRIHRRWTREEFSNYESYCLREIERGAIPISPAIHPAEKEIIRKAVGMGSSIIILRDLSFNERFKPSGEHFELCAAGRLLLISPWPDNHKRRSTAGYTEFHSMNDHAAAIAALQPTARFSISFR